MKEHDLTETIYMGKQGRIVVPARIRAALDLGEGAPLKLVVTEGELHLLTVQAAVDRARKQLGVSGPPAPGAPTWSEQLIAGRRRAAESE
ncbi:MAG: AbrB/MazE/SpoVT family DNA-binding domain-containing protein [Thermoleophilia bacterium]|nr:AbrB/MazE/SpoVT family DNA-binding domain-containing protein [Thermoleophilia bacterium]